MTGEKEEVEFEEEALWMLEQKQSERSRRFRKNEIKSNERQDEATAWTAFGVSYIFLKIYVEQNADFFGREMNSVCKTC